MSEAYLVEDVRKEFKKSRSYFRVARAFDIPLAKVKAILGDDLPPIQYRESRFNGKGRPAIQKYIVASKYITDEWNNSLPEIAQARSRYEAGTHTMATGRDGDTSILYSIPLTRISPKPKYFTPVSSD